MPAVFDIELAALIALGAYLGLSVLHRQFHAWRDGRRELARIKEFRRQWRPRVLDGSTLHRRLARLRVDHAATLHSRSRPRINLRAETIRHAIVQRQYFTQRKCNRPDCDQPGEANENIIGPAT